MTDAPKLTDDLRDEERAGGFSADDDNETFAGAAPAAAADAPRIVIPVNPLPMQEPAPDGERRRPWIIPTLFGLPLLLLAVMVVILYTGRPPKQAPPVVEQQQPITVGQHQEPTNTVAPPVIEKQPDVAAPAKHAPPIERKAAESSSTPDATMSSVGAQRMNHPDDVAPAGSYEMQVIATPVRAEADKRAEALREKGGMPVVQTISRNGKTLYRVRLRGYNSAAAARADAARFGLGGVWIERTGP